MVIVLGLIRGLVDVLQPFQLMIVDDLLLLRLQDGIIKPGGTLHAPSKSQSGAEGVVGDEAAVRDLLGKLEADNCVMVCEGTVFLV